MIVGRRSVARDGSVRLDIEALTLDRMTAQRGAASGGYWPARHAARRWRPPRRRGRRWRARVAALPRAVRRENSRSARPARPARRAAARPRRRPAARQTAARRANRRRSTDSGSSSSRTSSRRPHRRPAARPAVKSTGAKRARRSIARRPSIPPASATSAAATARLDQPRAERRKPRDGEADRAAKAGGGDPFGGDLDQRRRSLSSSCRRPWPHNRESPLNFASIAAISASVKAGTSSGLRLVMMLPSVTAASSTTFAPALRRSVRIDGQLVARPPAQQVGLDQQPRPVADRRDRLVRVGERPDQRRPPSSSRPQLVGIADPAGQQQRVVILGASPRRSSGRA